MSRMIDIEFYACRGQVIRPNIACVTKLQDPATERDHAFVAILL
jgi:hypothetical protein